MALDDLHTLIKSERLEKYLERLLEEFKRLEIDGVEDLSYIDAVQTQEVIDNIPLKGVSLNKFKIMLNAAKQVMEKKKVECDEKAGSEQQQPHQQTQAPLTQQQQQQQQQRVGGLMGFGAPPGLEPPEYQQQQQQQQQFRQMHYMLMPQMQQAYPWYGMGDATLVKNALNYSPPNACDAGWGVRLQKREASVKLIKSTQEYKDYKKIAAEKSVTEPVTPRASDRNMSKREWEKAISHWRHSFKQVLDVREVETTRAISKPRQPPSPRNADDETWQIRLEKRQKIVMIIKGSEAYQQRPEVDPEPVTPDAFDRSMSKRQWDTAVMQWKKTLRLLDVEQSNANA